jgi:hypothetical protein
MTPPGQTVRLPPRVPSIVTVVVAAVAAVVGGIGCFTVNAEIPGTLRGDVASDETERVGVLAIEKNHWFYVFGLVGEPPQDFFSTELKKAVQQKGADGVANLEYQSELGCMDLVIASCTVGCITPRTYTLTGDIVRIKKAPLAGKPAKVAADDVRPSTKIAEAQQF